MKCHVCGKDFPVNAMHNVEFKGKTLKYCDTCYEKASKSEKYFEAIDKLNDPFFRRATNENANK